MRVAIIGAGSAGLATALFLSRQGHAVSVFEQAETPKPLGAGFVLQPSGQGVLARLGLLGEIEAKAARILGLKCVHPGGRAIIDLEYQEIDPTWYGLGLHRGVLFETLLGACRAEAMDFHFGQAVRDVPLERNERRLLSERGETLGAADLVVVANGARSSLQRTLPGFRSSREYPWGALMLMVKDRGTTMAADQKVVQVLRGARHMFGFLPTGRAPTGEEQLASLFYSMRADRVAAFREAGLDAFRAMALELHPGAAPLLEQIAGIESFLFARYHDVSMRHWHGDRIVVLGDAAHATSPQLGQGVNLALLDALILSECLAAEPLERALPRYSAERKAQLNYYQFATRALTPLFQSDSRFSAWLRDTFFPVSHWLKPLRQKMTTTMCGVDRGIVRRSLPPPAI